MERKGFIYKVTNTINGKIYIGQTVKPIEERWQEHIYEARGNNKSCSYLHNAMHKYGEKVFKFEIIESCNAEDLDEREIYWVAYFNSFEEGYNLTRGGKGKRILQINDEDICNDYISGMSLSEVAKKHSASAWTVKDILHKYNIQLRSGKEAQRLKKGLHVYCINENGERFDFDSLKEAAEYVIAKGLVKKDSDYKVIGAGLRNIILTGVRAYGFNWFCDDFDTEYILQEREKIKNCKKHYDRRHPKNRKSVCPKCGGLKDKCSDVCRNCYVDIRRKESICPEKEVLLKDIQDLKTMSAIARKYGVTSNTVKAWYKRYNLYEKEETFIFEDCNEKEFIAYLKNHSFADAAKKYGICAETVSSWLKYFGYFVKLVGFKCIETGEVFCTISDLQKQLFNDKNLRTVKNGVYVGIKNGRAYNGLHFVKTQKEILKIED